MRRTAAMCILLAGLAGRLSAQGAWKVTFERGSTTYSMIAHDTSTPQIRVVVWHPAAYSLRLSREAGGTGFALTLTAANGRLGATAGDAVILPGATILLLEVAPELRRRLATASSGASLIGHLGPVLDIWAPQGDDVRTAYGGMGGVTLDLPVTRRWSASVRADLTLTGSEATKAEESGGITRAKTMRRGRLALGITRTL